MRSTIHFVLGRRGVVLLASAVLLFASPLAAQDSAAEALGVAGGVEQTILERLTPAQAEAFLAGADPATIVLEDGTSLEEFLLEGLIDTASSSVYHPLNQCLVVRTATGLGGGKYVANKKRDHTVRGTCGVPAEATAVVMNAKVYAASGSGQVSVYPLGHTATPAVVNVQPGQAVNNMVTVALGSAGDFSVKPSVAVHAVLHTVGYFAPLVMGSGSLLDADTLDGLDSTDFATVAALATSSAAAVHWDNLTNIPLNVADTSSGDAASSDITDGKKAWVDGEEVTGTKLRFRDNGDGTVTDLVTKLIWLKDASCADLRGTDAEGRGNWLTAFSAGHVREGICGLTGNQDRAFWRLPAAWELSTLIDRNHNNPAISDARGVLKWQEGDAFVGVQSSFYWSSTTRTPPPGASQAWQLYLGNGDFTFADMITSINYVWPVRNEAR